MTNETIIFETHAVNAQSDQFSAYLLKTEKGTYYAKVFFNGMLHDKTTFFLNKNLAVRAFNKKVEFYNSALFDEFDYTVFPEDMLKKYTEDREEPKQTRKPKACTTLTTGAGTKAKDIEYITLTNRKFTLKIEYKDGEIREIPLGLIRKALRKDGMFIEDINEVEAEDYI